MPPIHLRTVVHDLLFGEQLAKLQLDEERIDEFIEGAEWALARNPESGRQVSETVWFVGTNRPPWMKHSYAIYYRFTKDEVTLLAIIKTEDIQL